MKQFYIFIFLVITTSITFAQKAKIQGKVIDSKTQEPVIGVAVVDESKNGVTTNVSGLYSLDLNAGQHILTFKFLGYAPETKKITIAEGELQEVNISLTPASSMLDEMVVSAGKFEQKMSDVTVSISTIKPTMIENNNTNSIETIIDKTPGVSIEGGQASIRGGSGYSYGAGSRVLLLIDDLPMISGDAGDVKWDFVPVEDVEQVEVIKGASSVLYGSSALDGVINVRTAYPGNTPSTKIIINNGFYCNPQDKGTIWWGETQPVFGGIQFMHSRKIDNFDLTFGGQLYSDQGWQQDNEQQKVRLNISTRYRDKKIDGLSYGINADYQNLKGGDFLLWKNGESGVYRISPLYIQTVNDDRMNIDPFIVYHSKNGDRHSLKGRYYQLNNSNDTKQSTRTYLFYGEYQFQMHLKNDLVMTSGLTGTYNYAVSDLYGNKRHFAANGALYEQVDKKFFDKLTLSLGARYETYKMDQDLANSKPVFRTGANYQLAKATFLRGSFGEGYRYPAIAEKYVSSSVGSLNVFPNPYLSPETGWSSEIGIKQGFRVSSWYGYADVAGFWTQYHNMIEFNFGSFYPDSLHIGQLNSHGQVIDPTPQQFINYTGFKAFNITNAQINGVDITIMGQGKLFGLPATLLAGYTYTNPINLDLRKDSLGSTNNNILKYRFFHSAKADLELSYKKISGGVNIEYNSFMVNIDKVFEEPLKLPNGAPLVQNGDTLAFLPGLKQFREKHHTGDIVFDVRLSYQITEISKISIIVKNLLNREYMTIPGDVQPPRNIAMQLALKF